MKETRKTFFERLIGKMSEADIALVEFAYDLSKEAHRTHKRAQGERYFEHPRAGCLILMDELNVYDRDLIICFLIHDVGEDSPLFGMIKGPYDEFVKTATFRLERVFNERVARITIKMTKPSIDGIRFHTKEDWYGFYVTGLAEDHEADLMKAVDRLHNLRTIPQGGNWARKQSAETREHLLPIFRMALGNPDLPMKLLIEKIEVALAELDEPVPA